MLPLSHLIAHQGGIARGTTLQRFGATRPAIARAVHDGAIVRVRQGVFAAPRTSPDIVAAAEHGGALTCSKALRLHEIWTLHEDSTTHVWMGHKGRVHHLACECVSHWNAGPTPLGLARLEDVLVHTFHCRGDEAFFVALESALRKRRIGSIRQLQNRLPATARWLLDLARRDADSGLESLLRLRLHLIGIRLDCQVSLPGVGRVDFVIGDSLILEADGDEHHGAPAHRHRDLQRDAAASALGYETLRFDYAMIVHDWPRVQVAVLAALVRSTRYS